jgi:hypothetical protein
MPYCVVQPWGVRAGEWTLMDTRSTVADAFAALDALSERMVRTGAPSDVVELIVGGRLRRAGRAPGRAVIRRAADDAR